MRQILIFISVVLFSSVKGISQGEIYQLGNNNDYCAGDYYTTVEGYKAKQYADNWCWAACIQMVLKKQGLYVDQCDIVIHGFGEDRCQNSPADCSTIEQAAGGWRINGRVIRARVDNDPSPHDFINDLAYHYPLVIGLNMPGQNVGHAFVLTAIFFRYSPTNVKIPYKVVLRDPWPTSPSRVELPWSDFVRRLNCVTHVTF